MCEKCIELDSKIEHYRAIASKITDEAMIRAINVLIARAKGRRFRRRCFTRRKQSKAASDSGAPATAMTIIGKTRRVESASFYSGSR
jgi:hypothetical protein